MLKSIMLATVTTAALAIGGLGAPSSAKADVCVGPRFGGGYGGGFGPVYSSRSFRSSRIDPYAYRYGSFGPSYSRGAAFNAGFNRGFYARPRRGVTFSFGY